MGQGGAEKIVYQLCADINTNNYIASSGGFLAKKLKTATHYTIPDLDSKNPIDIIKTIYILKKILKKEHINLIHSHHRMGAFYARIIGKNIPKIYTAHNVFHDKRFLTKFSLKDTKCIACGNTVKLNLKDFFNINNVSVIKNSVKVPTKISAPKDKILSDNSKILVGFIGRLTEQKGADIFIEALANAIKNSPNIHGIIVGDGELKEQLQLLSKQFRVDDRITFLGMRKDVYPIIKMLDFVVLPSRYVYN